MKIKVEGHDDLVREESSNAIVNTNKSAYLMARKRADEAPKVQLPSVDAVVEQGKI